MNASEQEYMAAIFFALEKTDIDPGTRGDVITVLHSLKGNIIRM